MDRARLPSQQIEGKVAVVTGAARGIGAAFAQGLAEQGVTVVGTDIDASAMETTAAAIMASATTQTTVHGSHLDVTDPAAHDAVAHDVMREFGRLDIWVNNAGIFPAAPIPDVPPDQFRATLEVNLEGALYGSQAAARVMAAGGTIVNMASVSSVRVRRGRAAYCASKAGVDHLTRCLAVELGDRGIRVNAIAPGFVDTPMTQWLHDEPGRLDEILRLVPLHRLGTTQDILGVLLFLVSDAARYVTGATIAVDGGARLV